MTAPIDDVSSLPGKKVTDQEETPIGEVKEIYATEGDGVPTWVTVEASFGVGDKRIVFIPIARIKDEDGKLRVPYSKAHIGNTPQIDASDGITPECERTLRDHYGIDRADQELRTDNLSYATMVPEQSASEEDDEGNGQLPKSQLADDVDSLETPDADRRDEETRKRLEDPGSSETRNISADEVTSGVREKRDSGGGGSEAKRGQGDTEGKQDESEGKGESDE